MKSIGSSPKKSWLMTRLSSVLDSSKKFKEIRLSYLLLHFISIIKEKPLAEGERGCCRDQKLNGYTGFDLKITNPPISRVSTFPFTPDILHFPLLLRIYAFKHLICQVPYQRQAELFSPESLIHEEKPEENRYKA